MKKIVLTSLIFSLTLSAQIVSIGEPAIKSMPLTQGNVIGQISGYGFSKNSMGHISNINSYNPAGLFDIKKISAGISYQYESSIDPAWYADIGYRRKNNSRPQSAGLVIPVKNFRCGFGFSQKYNSILEGDIEISTIEQPNGTGEYISAKSENIVTCYSSILSYSFENIFNKNHTLSIGFQGGYNQLDIFNQLWDAKASTNVDNFTWSLGLRYDLDEKLVLGIFYEQGPSIDEYVTLKLEGDDTFISIDTYPTIEGNNDEVPAYLETSTYPLEGELPDRLNIGCFYELNSSYKIAVDISEFFWNQVSENFKNTINISGSLIKDISECMSLSLSFLSTGRHYTDSMNKYYHSNEKLYGFYQMGGLNLHFKHFDIDCAYANSFLLSGKWRKQQIGKIAMGFYL